MRRWTLGMCPLVIVTAFSLGASCSEGTGPGPLGLAFTKGNNQTDTAYAELGQALIVRVAGVGTSLGLARGSVVVRFQSLPFDSLHPQPGVYVSRLTSQQYSTFVAESSDARGEAAVVVKLGTTAGTGRLRVTVPELNLDDTATFTVLPGMPARVVAMPKDTALFVTGSFQANGTVTDRWGNPRTEPVTYGGATAGITVSSGGSVSAATIGRSRYVASAGALSDTAFVSVVPTGAIAAFRPASGQVPAALVMLRLDGSGLRQLTTLTNLGSGDPHPRWDPTGTRLIYSIATGAELSRLHTVDTLGTVNRLIAAPPSGLDSETWPQYSRDGQYVYFGGRPAPLNFMVWRVAANGTGAVRLSPDSMLGYLEFRPSPSPEGSRLAYVGVTFGAAFIRVKYFAGDTTSTWYVNGNTPMWSPSGDQLVYVQQYGGPVFLVGADGTGLRRVSQAGRSYDEASLDWSPDGQWIVVREFPRLALINVASGLTLPLPLGTGALTTPTWRP